MKLAKSFLVGCVGGLVALSGAQAAPPVEYVKVCSLYGAGYYYIPGTDVCMKVGSYVRWQSEIQSNNNGLAFGSSNGSIVGGRFTRESDQLIYNGRAVISADTRQQTEYGTLRTYVRIGGEVATGESTSSIYMDRAYIQFAGFTAGLTQSYFDIFSYTDRFGYIDSKTSGDTYKLGAMVFAYTAMLGNGVSFTISAESAGQHYPAGVGDGTTAVFAVNGVTNLDTAAFGIPDIVANLRVDQAWGFIGVSGAVHRVAGAYYTTPGDEFDGYPADKYGWAAAAGGLIRLPWGDAIGVNFAWTKGAIGYATKAGNWQMYGSDGTVGVGWVTDGIFDGNPVNNTNTEIYLTNAWSVNAAFEHIWNPRWRTSLYGGYTKVWYDDEATTLINSHLPGAAGTRPCGVPVAGSVWPPVSFPAGTDNSCTPDFSFYQVGSRTQFTPVPGLDIGLDVFYTHLNTAYKGVGVYPQTGTRLAATALDDQGAWSAILRVQRNILP